MKMTVWSLAFFFVAILISTSILANFKISGTELSFGGASEHKKETITKSVTILNEFSDTKIDSIALYEFTPKNDFRSGGVEITGIPSSIDPAKNATVTVVVKPQDFDVVDDKLRKRGNIEIGSLVLKGNGVNLSGNNNPGEVRTNSIPLKLELKNDLDLVSIELKDEAGSTRTLSADATITIEQDADYELKFKVKNLFETASDITFQNVDIKLTSDDLDLDKSTSISEILAGKETEKIMKISVDDTGSGEVTVRVEGDDKFGGKHGELFTFRFSVQEKKDEEEEKSNANDADGDGVEDNRDICPNTVSICDVDTLGCPIDSDQDGACDALDPTPKPTTQPPRQQQQTQQQRVQTEPDEEETGSQTTKEKKNETPSDEDSTSGMIPFLLGFAVGILVTVGFSVLIKS